LSSYFCADDDKPLTNCQLWVSGAVHCLGATQGRHFSLFSGVGKTLTDFLGGGQNMKNTTFCRQKHQKVTIFQNQGGNAPPANDVPGATAMLCLCWPNVTAVEIMSYPSKLPGLH